jgi:8-hydroxy-5-deazaflavin:NADPH oxidoreductase
MNMTSELTRRSILGAATAAGTLIATSALAQQKQASGDVIAMIGTGNVGATLGKAWAAKGHRIVYGSRSPDSEKSKQLVKDTGNGATVVAQAFATKGASIVVLAAPSQVALEIVATLGDLSGKIIIDAMNAMSFKDGKLIEPDDPNGLAAQIQAKAPGALVVKAFNATNAKVMSGPQQVTGGPVTVPIAGADDKARAKVTALATQLGFDVLDMGGPEALRQVEHLGRIYVGYAVTHRPQRLEFNFRIWKA